MKDQLDEALSSTEFDILEIPDVLGGTSLAESTRLHSCGLDRPGEGGVGSRGVVCPLGLGQ